MTNPGVLTVASAAALRAKDFCDAFVSGSRPRFLFGRNQYALSIAKALDVDGFVDDFTTEVSFHGRPIVKLEDVPKDALLVNCVAVGRPITAQRRIDAFGYDQLDYYGFIRESGLTLAPIEYWTGFAEHFERDQKRYVALQNRLLDPLSKEVLSRIVNFRLTYDLDHMRPFSDTQARQYFENFLVYGDEEVFADIGGFDGVTSEEFARRCPNYKGVYIFEPNSENLKKASSRMGGDPRVQLVAAALGDQDGTVRFDCSGSSSRVTGEGSVEVQMARLDSLIDAGFTFLKMDVEGAEASVITGARQVIERHHPKIAVSVYHHPADLVDIPQQVMNIRDDYEVALRHYTEGFTETVMYFLPKS